MSATIGVRSATVAEVVDVERDPEFVGDREQVQHAVRGAAGRRNRRDRVLEGRRVTMRDGRTSRRTRSITSSPDRRAASSLAGSSAGMPLSPAGESPMNSMTMLIVLAVYWPPHAPGPGQADVLDLVQLLEADLAGPVRPDRLEDRDDGRVPLALVDTGIDRAVVEDEARNVEPAERHRSGRNRLVAADEADEAVEQVAARRQARSSRR